MRMFFTQHRSLIFYVQHGWDATKTKKLQASEQILCFSDYVGVETNLRANEGRKIERNFL